MWECPVCHWWNLLTHWPWCTNLDTAHLEAA